MLAVGLEDVCARRRTIDSDRGSRTTGGMCGITVDAFQSLEAASSSHGDAKTQRDHMTVWMPIESSYLTWSDL